jgi:hypothetical protein
LEPGDRPVYHLTPRDMGVLRPWQFEEIAEDMRQLAAAAKKGDGG